MLYLHANDWSLDDILGLAALKFRPLHEIYLLCFNTGINAVLSIFRRLISINVYCIYRRTHRKTFEDDMHYLQVNRGPWLSHFQCSNHLITVWRGYVYWLLACFRVAE